MTMYQCLHICTCRYSHTYMLIYIVLRENLTSTKEYYYGLCINKCSSANLQCDTCNYNCALTF